MRIPTLEPFEGKDAEEIVSEDAQALVVESALVEVVCEGSGVTVGSTSDVDGASSLLGGVCEVCIVFVDDLPEGFAGATLFDLFQDLLDPCPSVGPL